MRLRTPYLSNHWLYTLSLAFCVLLSSCTKSPDDFGPVTPGGDIPVAQSDRVIVLNEGNFMFGNGSVSVIDTRSYEVSQEVFKTANGYPLGDVPQSLMTHQGLGYILVNNSSKMEVVDMLDFKSVKTITGLSSPRQMAIVSEDPLVAWVTDLYANHIWKVDLDQGAVIGQVPAQGWNENIFTTELNAYVLNKKDSVIQVYSISTEDVVYTFNLGGGIVDFKKWSANELIVLSRGGLHIINLMTLNTTSEVLFDSPRSPSKMAVDTLQNAVCFLENHVYRYANKEITKVVELGPGSSFYGLAVNSVTGDVFISDAKDFVQPGNILKYSADFQCVETYTVGVNPGFLWVE